MRAAFAVVADVVAAAETVWNAMSDQLQQVAADLGAARQQAGIADDALSNALALAEADLGQLRDSVNSDPLALWQGGKVDAARLDRLQGGPPPPCPGLPSSRPCGRTRASRSLRWR